VPASFASHHPHDRHDVLVIDDFAETREAIVTMLQTKGFGAVGAESGPMALDFLQAGMRPCVILLDVRMPEMDGWQVWERMKRHEELARTSVVILSANHADDKRARAVGIREFLRKPIDGKALIAAVERHCSRRPTVMPPTSGGSPRLVLSSP
jgi:CheY-like chemotaxis protein